jgi:hypothetical protein
MGSLVLVICWREPGSGGGGTTLRDALEGVVRARLARLAPHLEDDDRRVDRPELRLVESNPNFISKKGICLMILILP